MDSSDKETSSDCPSEYLPLDKDFIKTKNLDEDETIYNVLSKQEIVEDMTNSLNKVSTVLEISVTKARILLKYFNWNTEDLLERFYSGDKEKLFEEAGIVNLFKNDSLTDQIFQPTSSKGREVYEVNSFVECHRQLAWCPSPDCNNAIKVLYNGSKCVTCQCGQVFCFQCLKNCHDPIKCDLLQKWIKKGGDNLRTKKWNTKHCPKCNAIVKKGGRYKHASCKNLNCKHKFCWVCLRDWNEHLLRNGYCNLYNNSYSSSSNNRITTRPISFKRYMCYCKFYMKHMQSLNFEKTLYEKAQLKMRQWLVEYDEITREGIQLVEEGVKHLCSCRQTLMYSYILLYYVEQNNQSTIFAYNLHDFENETECLSRYLKQVLNATELTYEKLEEMKMKIQDKLNYCLSRRDVLINHVKEGYEKNWWVYLE